MLAKKIPERKREKQGLFWMKQVKREKEWVREKRRKVLMSSKCLMPAANRCVSSTHRISLSSGAHNTSMAPLVSLLSPFHSVSWLTPLVCWTAATCGSYTCNTFALIHLAKIILLYMKWMNICYKGSYCKINIMYVTMQNMHNASGYISDVGAQSVFNNHRAPVLHPSL